MTARRAPARTLTTWVVFGESTNDTSALRLLIVGLRPALGSRVTTRRSPLVLIKGRVAAEQRKSATRLAQVVRAEQAKGTRVSAVVAHEDCDALEPAHEHIGKQIEDALDAAGVPHPIAATPAWEIEAWWLLFPEAVRHIVPTWNTPDAYLGTDLGRLQGAKEVLDTEVRAGGSKRRYTESDSPSIAAAIVELALLPSFNGDVRIEPQAGNRRTSCRSFGRFRRRVLAAPA